MPNDHLELILIFNMSPSVFPAESPIPVVDISLEDERTASRLVEGATRYGFVFVKGELGFTPAVTNDAFSLVGTHTNSCKVTLTSLTRAVVAAVLPCTNSRKGEVCYSVQCIPFKLRCMGIGSLNFREYRLVLHAL